MGKLDEALELLHHGIEIYENVERVGKVNEAMEMAGKTSEIGQLEASDEKLNKLRELGSEWNRGVSKMLLRDENAWLEWSGTNLFSARESFDAVTKTQELKRKLGALEEACDGLSDLVVAEFVAKNMDVKEIAKAFIPSIVAIDGAVAKEARVNFQACSANSSSVIKRLDKILPTLERMRDVTKQIQGGFAHKLAETHQNTSSDGHNPPSRTNSVPGPW